MMRATTLKTSSAGLDGLLAYYAGLAEDRSRPGGPARGPVDYYLDPHEPPGRWWGQGRTAAGVAGEVIGDDLRALLEGRHPASGRPLGRRFGDASARGFDATFSAPKSVSALWALSPDWFVRAEVLAAHDAAVTAALDWFESRGAVTRRGRDGVDQVDTRGITVALFRQHTSRTVDPQLHTHAVVAAKVQDPTGQWLSLDARFLKGQQRTIGWIYDAALRGELTRRLGVTWERPDGDDKHHLIDMTCIPDPVRDLLSQRSGQVKSKLDELIRRWSAEHDGADPDPRTIASLERSAAVSSRPAKAHGVDGAALHDTWADQVRDIGFDPDQLTGASLALPSTEPEHSDEDLAGEALRRVAGESSTWLRADIARHLATLVPTRKGAPATDVVARIDRLAAQAEGRCRVLAPQQPPGLPCRRDGRPVAEHVTDRRLTTETVLTQELDLQRWAERNAHPAPTPTQDPQIAAAEAIAGTAPLVAVVGPAGTGKTHTTARAVRHLRSQQRPVVGLAPSGKAADVLAVEAGCPTDTVAGFLTRHAGDRPTRWPAGTTVVLDEAGMASTDDLHRLVALVHRHRWRLVTVGDPAQLPSVGRGGVFAHWCATLPHHELTTPRRFDADWEAAASLALRQGEPAAAEAYADHQRLHVAHPALIARGIADTHQRHVAQGRSVAITTNTAETARAINAEIQRRLDPAARRARLALADGTHLGVGDQIATRRNNPSLRSDRGEQVRNRHTWTITHLDDAGDVVASHPERGSVNLPAAYVAEHVELGWAVTGYGNQGDTVDIGLAVLEPGTTRNHAYVALTRGRTANQAWLPDPTGTLDPADALAGMITHTPDSHSALATHAQLHRDAGLPVPDLELERSVDGAALPDPPTRADPPVDLAPSAPPLDDRVQAMRARLDRLQKRGGSGIDRSLGR